jgi:hypothetical protein
MNPRPFSVAVSLKSSLICMLLFALASISVEGQEAGTAQAQKNAADFRRFHADDRVEVVVPPHSLTLAEENEIPLRIHVEGLTSLSSYQTQYHVENARLRDEVDGSGTNLTILHHADGSAYVNVVPLRLGKVEFSFRGIFPDRVSSKAVVTFDVEPPTRRPRALAVDGGAPFPYSYLNRTSKISLDVDARYDNIKAWIRINPTFAKFKVRQADDVINLDESTAVVTPLHVGHALVETSFGGLTKLTCVVVRENEDSYPRDPYAHCEDLVQPGESLHY